MATIEYVYSAHSAFAYLGSSEIMRICAHHNAVLVHRPVLLSPVVVAQRSPAFRQRTQAHVDYFFGREIERWAEYRSVPIIRKRPTFHDADYSLASGMIIALGETGEDTDRMAHGLLEAHWNEDLDLSDRTALEAMGCKTGVCRQGVAGRSCKPERSEQARGKLRVGQREAGFRITDLHRRW
jgi:2-hydroxychromene-2-carboxylate isomerase